jgi:hypothetical protein
VAGSERKLNPVEGTLADQSFLETVSDLGPLPSALRSTTLARMCRFVHEMFICGGGYAWTNGLSMPNRLLLSSNRPASLLC